MTFAIVIIVISCWNRSPYSSMTAPWCSQSRFSQWRTL